MKIQRKRRDFLFRGSRPTIREYQPEDVKWLWAAARIAGAEVTQEYFMTMVEGTLRQADEALILEDRNNNFASGFGPIGLVLTTYDSWSLAPHVEWFPWTTAQNKVRGSVGFLQKARWQKQVGCVKIYTADKRWFMWLKRYLPIYFVGVIPNGRPNDSEFIFYLKGEANGRNSRRDSRRSSGRGDRSEGVERQRTDATEQLASSDTPTTTGDAEIRNVRGVVH